MPPTSKSLNVSPIPAPLYSSGVASVGTSEVQIVVNPIDSVHGLLLKAPGTDDDTPNTVSVYIGKTGLTADQTDSGGFPLAPGESIVLPLAEVNRLYAISSAASQVLNWILI